MAQRTHPHLTFPELVHRVWNHPRRLGFILANIGILAVIILFGITTDGLRGEGLASAPMAILGVTGMAMLIALWIGVWVAWAVYLIWRHRPHH